MICHADPLLDSGIIAARYGVTRSCVHLWVHQYGLPAAEPDPDRPSRLRVRESVLSQWATLHLRHQANGKYRLIPKPKVLGRKSGAVRDAYRETHPLEAIVGAANEIEHEAKLHRLSRYIADAEANRPIAYIAGSGR